jgi:hypothetical protein
VYVEKVLIFLNFGQFIAMALYIFTAFMVLFSTIKIKICYLQWKLEQIFAANSIFYLLFWTNLNCYSAPEERRTGNAGTEYENSTIYSEPDRQVSFFHFKSWNAFFAD